jgi:hypothetical protein
VPPSKQNRPPSPAPNLLRMRKTIVTALISWSGTFFVLYIHCRGSHFFQYWSWKHVVCIREKVY